MLKRKGVKWLHCQNPEQIEKEEGIMGYIKDTREIR